MEFQPGTSRIRSRLFSRSIYILFSVTLLAAVVSGWISVSHTKSLSERRVINLIDKLQNSFAYSAYQIDDFGIQTLLNTISTLPEVQGAAFAGDLQYLTSPASLSDLEIFSDCEVIYRRDLAGFQIEREILPKGEYRVCAKYSVLTQEAATAFMWSILPQFLAIFVSGLAFLHLVDNEFISRVVDLMAKIQDRDQLLIDDGPSAIDDEISALETALVERTRHLDLETTTADIVFENVDDGIAFTDLNDRITRSNELFRVRFVPGRIVRPNTRLGSLFTGVEGMTAGVWTSVTKANDNQELDIEAYRVDVQIPGIYDGRVYFFRDLTEQRQMERQAVQAQRLSAVGEVSGGVAHDFNNLLGVVIGCAELSLNEPGLSERAKKMLEAILASARRGGELTDKLLTFARRQKLNRKPIDPTQIVSQIAELGRRVLGTSSIINTEISATFWIEADATYFESALLNLLVNARDAMPNGGIITLSARDFEHDGKQMVAFHVEDTGIGIPPEFVEKVREPFFTTKEPGKGTGLGLSMVAGFTEQSGGTLEISSCPGATCVSIILPAIEQRQITVQPDRPPDIAFNHSSQLCILIVDDEIMFAEILEMNLIDKGFKIKTATSLSDVQALDDLSSYDLILCDVVLSGHYGYEIWEYFRQTGLDTPFLFMSGNVPKDALHQIGQTQEALIKKPFEIQRLVRKIYSLT